MLFTRNRIIMSALAWPLITGCRDAAAPVSEPVRPVIMARMISGDSALAYLRAVAPAAARRGDSSSLRHLAAVDSLRSAGRRPQLSAGMDPNDPATWGDAIIYNSFLTAELPDQQGYIYAGMDHDGHQAIVEMEFSLSRTDGTWSTSAGPFRAGDFNPMGKYNISQVRLLHPVYAPDKCGYALRANAHFTAFNVILPLPLNLGAITIPNLTLGRVNESRFVGPVEQPACPSNAGYGESGGGGSGDGFWATVTECWGYHVYSNGIYQYSVVEGCHSYGIFIRTNSTTTWT